MHTEGLNKTKIRDKTNKEDPDLQNIRKSEQDTKVEYYKVSHSLNNRN